VGDRIGYARVSTADQDPQLQLDALSAADCLKIYTDTATGTKADRPQRNACLVDLRRGDTLLIWKIDRLGRNLRDIVDIVTTLQTRGVGVRSLTNGIVDTTTAHGSFVFPKDSSRSTLGEACWCVVGSLRETREGVRHGVARRRGRLLHAVVQGRRPGRQDRPTGA